MKKPLLISSVHQLSPQKTAKKIVCIFAHPDDESLQIGGILRLAAQQQIKTHAICLTQGEAGGGNSGLSQTQLSKLRMSEYRKALAILKVKSFDIGQFPDGKLRRSAITPFLTATLNRLKPDIIITHDPSGMSGHPDHKVVSQTVTQIWRHLTFHPTLYYSVHGSAERKLARRYQKNPLTILKRMPLPTHQVSIKSVVTYKVKACLTHKSQMIDTWKNIDLLTWYTVLDHEFLHRV